MSQPTSIPGIFTRQATGLVRQAGAWSTLVYNINFVSIGLMMMFVIQLEPAFYPGGDMVGSYLLALLIVLPTSLCFAMLAAAMPRSGGDYVYVSRILGPRLGMTSSWTNTIWWFIYGGVPSAFFARFGLGPLLRSVGMLSGNSALLSLGEWLVTPLGTIVCGILLIAALVLVFSLGLGLYFRIQNVLFVVALVGLGLVAIVLLGITPDSVAARFNAVWNPLTGQADTYAAVVSAARAGGFSEAPPDLYWTLVPITWIYLELVFNQSSAYIGGEVRGASRTQLWSMPVAAIVSVAIAVALTALLRGVVGTTFLGALGWDPYLGDSSVLKLPYPMPFTELVADLSGSALVALVLGLGFVFWSYTWLPGQILNASRNLLAYGLDGVLPARLASVSERRHTPVVALSVVGALSIVALIVYATNPDFTTLVGIVAYIVSFALVSLAAILFPFRRPAVWASSPVNWRLGRIPVISIVGGLSLVACLVAEWAYLADPLSGVGVLANGFFGSDGAPTKDLVRLLIAAATVLSGPVIYEISRWYRAREGIRLEQTFQEIPVE
jgi:amino acid transporter